MVATPPDREITRWTSQKRAGRPGPITLAALHESVGITNAWDLALYCERRGVSYHDLADNTQLIHTVPFSDIAWHLRSGNPDAVGLCLTTPVAGYSRAEWLGPQVKKVKIAAWWLARTSVVLKIPVRHLTHPQIISALTGDRRSAGVLTHNDYTLATRDGTHTDPRGFPMDVCIRWADSAVRGLEGEDMAEVPQGEWVNVRNMIQTMYGDRGPDNRHVARRVDTGYVDDAVWKFPLVNFKGEHVAAGQVVAALEERIARMEHVLHVLAERSGGIPDYPSAKR